MAAKQDAVSPRDQLAEQESKYRELLSAVTAAEKAVYEAEKKMYHAKSDCLVCLQQLTSMQNTFLMQNNKQLAEENAKLRQSVGSQKLSASQAVAQVREENLAE